MKADDAWRRLTVREDVIDELCAQDDKWGTQDHEDVGLEPEQQRHFYAYKADRWKEHNSIRVKHGTLTWDGILLEEVYEALAEADPGRLYDELIQVAAVAEQWAEAILRRQDRDV